MEFVTFELAKKLKEKGYPQVKKNTLAMYDEDGEWYSLAATIDEEYCFEDFDKHDCVCPTISQVLKWLREVHNLVICAEIGNENDKGNTDYSNPDRWWWFFDITNEKGVVIDTESDYILNEYSSYEQAALAGIEYVLDNLIYEE